jgi:hypothetical protein
MCGVWGFIGERKLLHSFNRWARGVSSGGKVENSSVFVMLLFHFVIAAGRRPEESAGGERQEPFRKVFVG